MPQVSAPEGDALLDLANMPDPAIDDAFDLHLIEANDGVCRAVAPIFKSLQLALSDMSYTDNGAQYKEETGHRGALTLEFFNNVGGQQWIDGCDALIAELDAVVFHVYHANGELYSELRFSGLTEPEFTREFSHSDPTVQVLQYVWLFADVKETVKEQ
ncbi:hypothetical protein O152_gp317 [Pseudomonas phage PaBG]|nr:hypothetical protein O152_gp317 [Pseudomonas phage PaBG]AGS82046.2 hypothetical protein PaBG_00165 [Pseudomonas phage PaBG]